ncbi:pyridoxal phosphate-dependent transferase [Fomitopsis serialis]|uniref:pyridoxal phosphate-dependent transferase n=1 Tax=Fomitopsis serialis TaxID=139415 RepID=UPI0020081DDA|nr:pyridoxal phosphate-dependent transferase [Neoantrodia serialis]KAH9920624.1 pyridoxal phosphate-dependent transferase [Neoantrodia serialis]
MLDRSSASFFSQGRPTLTRYAHHGVPTRVSTVRPRDALLFGLEPGFANLNHGALGSVPRPVAQACERLSTQVEANPDRFMWFTYWPALDEVRASVAELIGARPDECVFVPNVSHGVSTVLRNFEWCEGDVVVISVFNTINGIAHNMSDMPPHPAVSEFPLHFPDKSKVQRCSKNKIVVVMDSVLPTPAVLMPGRDGGDMQGGRRMEPRDAAHSIGQEMNLDLTKAAPDFWISSCSKWLYAKRACAVLYVPKRDPTGLNYQRMKLTQTRTLVDTFKWPGTSDMLTPLSIKSALPSGPSWGRREINAYCHHLALAGGRRMAEILGTSMLYSAKDEEEYNLNMVNVELPIPSAIHMSWELMVAFQDKLINEHNTYSTQFYHNNKWWTRPCAQVFNELEDFERLGKALVVVCKEITEKFGERQD